MNRWTPWIRTLVILASAWLGTGLPGQAQTLLAGWTFNSQGSQTAALTADQGTLAGTVLSLTGTGLTLNGDGTVGLGTGAVLYTNAINSTAQPTLLSNVTIWVSFTLTGAPGAPNNAIFGLTTATPYLSASNAGVAGAVALAYQVNTGPQVRVIGTYSDNTTVFGPGSGLTPITVGTQNSAAIVFSKNTSYADDTNGTFHSQTPTAMATLDAFTDFAIGRLFSSGNDGAITVNEVRIYDGAMTSTQIAGLSPTPVPEPGAAWLLAPALLAWMGVRRRPRFLPR